MRIARACGWLLHVFGKPARQPHQTCATCRFFADHSSPDDDPDEVNGYCCHPDHSDPAKSPHYEYGGHWTHAASWCDWWEQDDKGEP